MKKLFGWITKLVILCLVAVIAWIIYANRDQMALPNGTSAVTEGDKVVTQTEQSAPLAAASEPQPTPAPTQQTVETQTEAPVTVESPAAAEPPMEEKAAEVAEAPESPAAAEPAAETSPAESEAPAPAPSSAEASDNPPLEEARKTALTGEMEKAESAYQQLQKEQPDNYDAFGELGNLYLMQGKDQEAADAYYQAAVLLDKAGHSDDAIRLLRVVSRLNEELGVKLEQALKAEPRASGQ